MRLHGAAGGASAVHYGLACRGAGEAADSGIRSLVSVQGSLAMFAIASFETDEQKRQWLPGMAPVCSAASGLTRPKRRLRPGRDETQARR